MATPDDLAETVRGVEALGRRTVSAAADVRDLAALTAVAGRAVAELGRLDIVVANAGISTPAPALEMDETFASARVTSTALSPPAGSGTR